MVFMVILLKCLWLAKPSVKASRICKITQECLMLGIHQVKPGIHLGEIGKVIGTYAK